MTFLVELSAEAEWDLKTLYLEKNSGESKAAARWFNGLEMALDSLATLPHRCPLAPEAAELKLDLRQLLYGKKPHIYRVVFEVDQERRKVWVLTIRHGARLPLKTSEI